MAETLDYSAARQLCGGCQFADPTEIRVLSGKFVVGCHAPIQGQVISQSPVFRVVNHDDEISEDDPDRVRVQLRFVPEKNIVCFRYADGQDPIESVCPKADIALQFQGRRAETVIFRSDLKNTGKLRLQY